jgi:hypothetical protein
VIHDSRLTQIEAEIRGFVQASYPDMIVRAEYWAEDPSRIALFFVDERFRTLYQRQRYHYLVHLIPKDYYDAKLADTLPRRSLLPATQLGRLTFISGSSSGASSNHIFDTQNRHSSYADSRSRTGPMCSMC